MNPKKVLILKDYGSLRTKELALLLYRLGAEPLLTSVTEFVSTRLKFSDFSMVILPDGPSFANILGPGKLFSYLLKESTLGTDFLEINPTQTTIVGIGTGFHTLLRLNLFPNIGYNDITFKDTGFVCCEDTILENQTLSTIQATIQIATHNPFFEFKTPIENTDLQLLRTLSGNYIGLVKDCVWGITFMPEDQHPTCDDKEISFGEYLFSKLLRKQGL